MIGVAVGILVEKLLISLEENFPFVQLNGRQGDTDIMGPALQIGRNLSLRHAMVGAIAVDSFYGFSRFIVNFDLKLPTVGADEIEYRSHGAVELEAQSSTWRLCFE